MPQQIFDPEVNNEYLDGPSVSIGDIDPAQLSSQDFYWSQLEAAEGDPGKAACSLGSKEEAVRFIEGMQEELLDTGIGHGNENLRAISHRLRGRVTRYLESSGIEIAEDDPRPALWAEALDYLSAKEIAGNIDEVIGEVGEAKDYLEQLSSQLREDSMSRFSLAPEEVEELELMASGVKTKQRAGELDSSVREVSEARSSIINKLKAKSHSHAVRIALEEGIISLDNPVSASPVSVVDTDAQILDLYSQGKTSYDIGRKQKRSFKAIRTRVQCLVEKFSAKSRPNLTYMAIEQGIIPIKTGKTFHVNNALRQLEVTELLLASGRAQLDEYMGVEETSQTGRHQSDHSMNGHADSSNTSNGSQMERVDDSRMKTPTKKVLTTLKTLNNNVLLLLSDAYRRDAASRSPSIAEEELEELEMASQGFSVTERMGNDSNARNSLTDFRTEIKEKLGAHSITHAVARAVEMGVLPVQWSRREGALGIPAPDRRILGIISLLSEGLDGKGIKSEMDFSARVLTDDTRRAYEELSANDWPSLVYSAFEKGLIAPGTRHKPLHSLASFLETAERHLAVASNSLNGMDSVAINRRMSGLTARQIEEIVRASEGATAEDRADERDMTTGGVDALRFRAAQGLGAKNMTQAVFNAIKRGIIRIEPAEEPSVKLPEESVRVLLLAAKGKRHSQIAKSRNTTQHSVSARTVRIRRALEANTTAQAVRRAFEEGIFKLN